MTKVRRQFPLCALALALCAGLPAFASAQTIRGFSVTESPRAADEASDSKLRLVETPIANRYIVVLKASAAKLANETENNGSPIESVAKFVSRANGARLLMTYSYALRGFVVDADADALTSLLADERVEYVEQDSTGTIDATQVNAPWGLDRIDQRNLPLNGTYVYNTTASNVHAYVIDTGLRATHNEFIGRVGNGYSALNTGGDTSDCNGHGTHVAGIIGGSTWGVAKGVTIHPVRVGSCGNGLNASEVIRGVDWVTGFHATPAVANMSLSFPVTATIDTAVSNLIASGVTVVAAAGNDNGANACNKSPAHVAAVITVGSTESNDARSSFSNTGSCLDLFAPGGSIPSAWNFSDVSVNTISGTSMASPQVAGAAAIYLATSASAAPVQVANTLVANATTGKVSNAGSGSPNRLLYIPNTPPANLTFRPGFSGTWYNPGTSGQGHFIEIDPQHSLVFSGWYTFDLNGQQGGGANQQRWYTTQATYSPSDTSKTMTVYRNTGGNFDAPPTTSSVAVGTATLSFQSCSAATYSYQINVDGQFRSGTIPLTRLGSDQYCQQGYTPSFSLAQSGINPSLNGAWFEPATSGQGFQFYFSPQDGNLISLAWYTYDVNGQSGSGPAGQRWYTIQGSYTPGSPSAFNVPIYATTGGRFDVSPPSPVTTQVGTATLSFSSCSSATLSYSIPGRASGTIPLTRLSGGSNCSP